jgi:anti-sigma factor RsiW
MLEDEKRSRCGFTEEDLLLYYYGEPGKGDAGELAGHLPDCAACRQSLDRIARTLASLPPAPLDISAGEANRFARRVTAQIGRPRYGRIGLWGGALATAALVLTFGMPHQPAERSLPAPAHMAAEIAIFEHLELLQTMELLEDLDLLLELGPHG